MSSLLNKLVTAAHEFHGFKMNGRHISFSRARDA